MQETWVWSLGWEEPLEKGKATHPNILAWRNLWTIKSMGLQRDDATCTWPPQLLAVSPSVGLSLQFVHLHWHVIITPSCISIAFTLWCCASMTLEKCIMTCIYHYNVKNSFVVLKILSALPIISFSPSLPLGNHWSFYYLLIFAFFRMSSSPLQIFEFTLDFTSSGKAYNNKIYLILLNVAAFILFLSIFNLP